jgi:hypothetical protein
MNRTQATEHPEALGPSLHQRTRRTLQEPFDALPCAMGDDEELPEVDPQHYAGEYEESEAAGEAPYWATWGF